MIIKNFIGKLFLRFGERIALVPIIILFAFIFTVEKVDRVNAEQEVFKQNYKFEGLIVMVGSLNNIEFVEETASQAKDQPRNSLDREKISKITIELESIRVPATPTPIPSIVLSDDIWEKIAQCESKGNWSINTGNGYFGGLQFSQGAWNSVGGSGLPSDHSKEEQIERGKQLQARRGWGVWGLCAKKLNLL